MKPNQYPNPATKALTSSISSQAGRAVPALASGLLVILFFSGCDSLLFSQGDSLDRQGRKIKVSINDTVPQGVPKGYAEFYFSEDTPKNLVLWICREGHEGNVVGPDQIASHTRFDRLRFAAEPGLQKFEFPKKRMFFKYSDFIATIEVPIREGKVTPVEIKLTPLAKTSSSVNIQLDSKILEPIPIESK